MISFSQGYLVFGRDVPVRFHWSVPVGALVLGGFEVRPWFWLAFVVLVLLHELGHAMLVWRYGKRVLALDVSGLGGLCHWRGEATPFERAAIAWGGVLAQASVLLVTFGLGLIFGPPKSMWSAELYSAFTRWNLTIIGINLLPIPPLDGAKAWPILGLWRDRKKPVPWQSRARDAARSAGPGAVVIEPAESVWGKREQKTRAEIDAEVAALVEKANRAVDPKTKH